MAFMQEFRVKKNGACFECCGFKINVKGKRIIKKKCTFLTTFFYRSLKLGICIYVGQDCSIVPKDDSDVDIPMYALLTKFYS